ncbi:ogr/Delta-like zinc finger family protein [Pseudoalteromonas sp. KG3]|uniref:ogr/Delta-like zinc finger family protein n=1 Tax=Pseudoalteromonas TaxID=53246 RepID=UPI0026594987|nr:ogr/Delta-like zinc finger family protein [Pseudoalteromonas sp. KG3]WKD23600.1 ogr/Delta-like zinc finger family protein [Pseudoalteromonas sp. KG3]
MARVTCPNCEAKATITSREKQSAHVVNLYCSCTNTKECGATFRITQSFDHFLNPPIQNTQQLAASLLKNLSKEQQLSLLGV